MNYPHRRYNALRGEWVLVSPQRNERPWKGQVDAPPRPTAATYDPDCYLCPGNERVRGVRNPSYTGTFAFDNDFPALAREIPAPGSSAPDDLLHARDERGICRVICFSPRHDASLGAMDNIAIRAVVDTWISECAAAAAHPWVKYALVFENRGEMMGASSPHPHCQLWATEEVPNEPARERDAFNAFAAAHGGKCLLCEYAGRERHSRERLVCENDAFTVIVPFWAVWPFETLIVSRRHVDALGALAVGERDALADILRRLAAAYDRLFDAPFPYSMGFHPAPFRSFGASWHLHAHLYPPLLRSSSIRKFMVGFELLGEPQRDFTPEDAAARLREVGP